MLSRDAQNILDFMRFAMVGRLHGRLAALAFAALLAGPAAAQAPGGTVPPAPLVEVFTVGNVAVDATAETAAAARTAAVADGERRAFRRLLERLTLAADRGRLPTVDAARLNELVQDFEIADERTSATRYIARLTVRFRPDGIRTLLRGAGIPFSETASKPLLVIPVFEQGGERRLWEEPNPWREAWAARGPGDGLVRVVAPLGDLDDIAAIDADKAVAGDEAALGAVARRYGLSDTLVALASLAGEAPLALQVSLQRFGAGGARYVVETFTGGDSPDALMRSAVAGIVARLEESWKSETVLRFGDEARLSARVPIESLADWIAVRERLGRVAEVRRVEVAQLTRRDAQVVLHHLGSPQQLQLALAQRDLELGLSDGFWTLRLAKAPGAAAPPPAPPASPTGSEAATPPAAAPGSTDQPASQ